MAGVAAGTETTSGTGWNRFDATTEREPGAHERGAPAEQTGAVSGSIAVAAGSSAAVARPIPAAVRAGRWWLQHWLRYAEVVGAYWAASGSPDVPDRWQGDLRDGS